MKNLYVIAGGSDGYVDFTYTFDQAEAEEYLDRNEDSYGDSYHNVSVLLVPDDYQIKEGEWQHD